MKIVSEKAHLKIQLDSPLIDFWSGFGQQVVITRP